MSLVTLPSHVKSDWICLASECTSGVKLQVADGFISSVETLLTVKDPIANFRKT